MSNLSNYINGLPLGFSLNTLSRFKENYLILLGLDSLEYKGKVEILDKNFNSVLYKCSRLSSRGVFPQLDMFEILFIRGENIVIVAFTSKNSS